MRKLLAGNLADSMYAFQSASFGARMVNFVKGVRIKTVHQGYRKTVKTISKKNAREERFKCEDMGNRMVTVEEYFNSSTWHIPMQLREAH